MKNLAKLLSIVFIGAVVFPSFLMWRIVVFAKQDQAQPADAAIVLGAGVFRGRPSPILRARIDHAIKLYEDGTVEKLIFTGGIGRNDTVSEANASRQYALAQGVPAADILLEDKSTSTVENLRFAAEIGAAAGLENYLIVSTPYHMRRATWIAHDIDINAASSPTRTIRWISDATRRRALIQETLSLSLYTVRRWSPATFQTTGQRN